METNIRVNILEDAQDIAVLRNLGNDNYIYSAKPSLDKQEYFYGLSVSDGTDKEIPAFQKHWQFGKNGITGSSTYLALRFDKKALRPSGLWLPGLLEGRELDRQGKLENEVYRDYGVVVYTGESPNEDIAKRLSAQAEKLKFQLPLIVPFKDLEDDIEGKDVKPYLIGSPQGIISGEEAKRQIESLNYKANSGVHRLDRIRDGSWDADWDYLDCSDDDGRVDWVCGEATRADLEDAHSALLGRKYGEAMRKEKEAFRQSLIQ